MPTRRRTATPSKDTASGFVSAGWAPVVAAALAQALDALEATADEATLFHRTFPLGEALGDLFKRQAANGKRPLGLVDLIQALVPDGQAVGDGTTEQARQALLAGLCWRLEEVVALGSRLGRELGELPDGDPLGAARERARAIASELRQRRR